MSGQAAPWQVSRYLPIFDGESVDGYVSRVAAAHHMPRMAEITKVGGATASLRPHASFCDAEGLDAIADCLRVDRGVFRFHAPMWSREAGTLNFFGTKLPRHFFQFAARRFSPGALKISPHHRALWMLRIFPFCSEAWEYLEDRCPHPACGRRQVWRCTAGINLCDYCAEPLTRVEPVPVPDGLRANLHMLVGLVHPDSVRREQSRAQLPLRLAMMDSSDLLVLACSLAGVIDHRTARPLTRLDLGLSGLPQLIAPALAGAWEVLRDWPGALESLLVNRINRHAKGRGDGNNGASWRFLFRTQKSRLPADVRALVSDFIQRCRSAKSRGVTCVQASKQSGVELSALVAMRRSGTIPSVLATDGCRLHVLLDKEAVNRMTDQYRPRDNLGGASSRVGIPTYALRELTERGLLRVACSMPGRTEQLSVERASLLEFIEAICAKLVKCDEQWGVSLATLMLRIGGRPKPWAGVLAAIHAGHLHASVRPGKAPLAKRIAFKDEAVLALQAFAHNDDMDWRNVRITKGDVADIVNLGITKFSGKSDFLLGEGGQFREIYMEDAIRLAERFISTREIAKRLQVHHTAAYKLALDRGAKEETTGLFDRASIATVISELIPQKN